MQKVTLRVHGPSGTVEITCPVSRPQEGDWSCTWDGATDLPDEATVTVSVQATDIYGQSNDWSPPQSVVVDARPPVVVPDLEAPWSGLAAAQPLAGRVFRGGSLALYGSALDAAGVASVRICAGDACAQADLQPGEAEGENRWSFRSPALGALDYVSRTVTVSATDQVGNATTSPLSAVVTIDNVAPQLSAFQAASSTRCSVGPPPCWKARPAMAGHPSM